MQYLPILSLVATLALPLSLRAQATLEPSLGVAFPVKEAEGRLVVESDVLINANEILPAGTVLHKLFPRPKKDDKDVRGRKIKEYDTGKYQVNQRLAIENHEVDPDKSAVMRAAEARASGESMTSELKFRAALHRMNIEEYYLAYDLEASKERRIVQFDYPEGLLLAEQRGKIVVLAVANGSLAKRIGVEPGSFLLSMDARPLKSLEEFRNRYFKEKEQKKQEGKALAMAFLFPGHKEPRELEFQLNRSLGTQDDLMSDLSAKKAVAPASSNGESKETPKKEVSEDEMNVPLIP